VNPDHSHKPSPVAILVVPLVVALILTLFAWPSARLEPRDLPIGVAGPAVAADPLERRLASQEGAFDVKRYPGPAEARAAIEDREVYGAWVAGSGGLRVLTSSAASPAVAQLLGHAAAEAGDRVAVMDVAPAGEHGTALGSSVLPLVIAGILTGIVASLLATGGWARAGVVTAIAALTGLAAAAIVQSWLEVIEGDWAANAAAFGLTVLAIGAFVAGSYALFGVKGAGVAAALMVFVGNPFSGVASAPELLPQPVGLIGQLMPPGAGGNLVRSTGYFDGAAAGDHVAVLAAWALAGLAALVVAGLRRRRPAAAASAVAA
jgi:hypothetical protein